MKTPRSCAIGSFMNEHAPKFKRTQKPTYIWNCEVSIRNKRKGGNSRGPFFLVNTTLYRRASAPKPAVCKPKIIKRGHFMRKIVPCQKKRVEEVVVICDESE